MPGDDVVQFTTTVSLYSGNNKSLHWLYLFSKMLTPETCDTAVVEGSLSQMMVLCEKFGEFAKVFTFHP